MTICTPLKPFRCWQYHANHNPPKWITYLANGISDGWWAVQGTQQVVHWYSPAAFVECFKVTK
jgi:hypothetical protein